MQTIETVSELEALYDLTVQGAIDKVCDHITPLYRRWIDASRFVILSTVGPEGTDASPRGDRDAVVRVATPTTVLMPDWRGNNRLDSLKNIVRDGRLSLMFMVPGSNTVVRVNGTATLTAQTSVTEQFAYQGKLPRTVIVIAVAEVYFQCAKALMRSRLWSAGDESEGLPTAGEFLEENIPEFDAAAYDAGYPEYAKNRLW
jgi:PPOX class probable FMN-dependent enzyme